MPTYTLISLFVFSTALIYVFVVEIEGCVRRIDAKLDVIASIAAISGAIFFLADLQSVRMLNKNSDRLNQEVSLSKSIAESERSLTMSFLVADAVLEQFLSACELISTRDDPFVISPDDATEQRLWEFIEGESFRREDCHEYEDFQTLSRVLAATPIIIIGLERRGQEMAFQRDSHVFLRIEETVEFVSELNSRSIPLVDMISGETSQLTSGWSAILKGTVPGKLYQELPDSTRQAIERGIERSIDLFGEKGISFDIIPSLWSYQPFDATVADYREKIAELNALPEVEEISPLPIEWVYLIIFAVALETAKACRIVARDASGQ